MWRRQKVFSFQNFPLVIIVILVIIAYLSFFSVILGG